MQRSNTWLAEHKADVYSQTGEDGVIEQLLAVLPDCNRWCVEFGAWDGLYASNTCNLIKNRDYAAVLIEASPTRFVELKQTFAGNGRVTPLNAFVGFTPQDNLDQILAPTPIPRDFDLLSIDVDGNDYHIWKAVEQYRPKCVCIEFNPTIPTEIAFVQAADPSVQQGCSLLAATELANSKGYELVSVLPWNAFFVRAEYFPLFGIADNRPETLRTDLEHITYFFSGFDGTVFLRGSRKLLWHNLPLDEGRLQYLPKRLRKSRSEYGPLDSLLFRALKVLRRKRSPPAAKSQAPPASKAA